MKAGKRGGHESCLLVSSSLVGVWVARVGLSGQTFFPGVRVTLGGVLRGCRLTTMDIVMVEVHFFLD